MRITVRVQANARQTAVGGRYGLAQPPVLLVRVVEPAFDGRANRACVAALASAFSVRRDGVRIVSGASSRTKIVEVDGISLVDVTRLLQQPGRS